ncbi:hypothetical protein A5634_12020 [Mycobacterium asiaticum]|uniref:VWFA domain-containing protein n=1 Tax=Mycobacterium asiaticum TaxID=1790 RepID=A0A1A3NHA2_MYCAS|nr:vWA domain-containing protein [Mycobacterium asiaticum]OBK20705.1 hypothetical protein A5634_12020 [Mycobacterium asiaticum]
MTFEPLLPWAILAVVAGALTLARLVSLQQVLWSARRGSGRRLRAVLRWSGVTMVVLLILVAVTRPGLRDDENHRGTTKAGEHLNVFLIVDRSADSAVEDYGLGLGAGGSSQSRITGMRADIAALTQQYPAARYALITFASRAALDWPLSEDVWSLRPTIAALRPYQSGPDGESSVDAAAASNVLRYQLMQATQQYPGSRNVVLYFGSGAPSSRAPQGEFQLPFGSVSGGAVLGYGLADAINEAELRKVAGQLAVPYLHRDSAQAFRPELPDSPSGRRAEAAKRTELYWVPALLAAALLLGEIYLSVREFRRGRIARRDMA